MLHYIYVESSNYDTIDLQVSKEMKKELSKLHRTAPVPWSKLPQEEQSDEDSPFYRLEWYPYDGYSAKWYHVDGFAAWVSKFCTCGQLFQFTQEDTGGLWGWEFNNGRFRELELRSRGRWRKS
jgi:hypothetical protein